jgi:Terminase RNaseH-like domain
MSDDFARICSDFSLYAPLLHIKTKADEQGLSQIIPFRFNAVQWRYHFFKQQVMASGKPVRIVILKYRQGGFTTYEQAESFWLTATRPNQKIMTIAHKKDSTIEIFQMVQLMYKHLDEAFKPSRKGESKSALEFPGLNSKFFIGTAGADTVGDTLNKLHASEFALWPDPFGALHKMQDTVPITAPIVIESTANGYNEFEELYSKAKKRKNAYFPFFIRWFDDVQYQVRHKVKWAELEPLSTDEEALVRNFALMPEQIAWRRWKIAEKNGDMDLFWENYPENDASCFMNSGKAFFNNQKILAEGQPFADAHPPQFHNTETNLKIWEDPIPGRQYIAGADPAEGVEEDNSSYTLIEAESARMVLTLANDTITPIEFAKFIADTGRKYNNAYTVVERNNHGHTVINELVNHLHYGKRSMLYYHRDLLEDLKPVRHRIKKQANASYKPGFPSQVNTKPALLDYYKKVVEEIPQCILDSETFEEIKTFIRHPNGKLGAAPQKHDDRVISHALAWHGRNCGIPKDNFSAQFQIY